MRGYIQSTNVHIRRLIKRFQELEQFDTDDQEAIIKVIDAMIMKNKIEGAMSPLDSRAE